MAYKRGASYLGDEKPFNFAQLLLERCNDLFKKCNEAATEGDPFYWYRVLNAIKRAISFKLTDEELEDLDKKFLTLKNKIKIAQQKKSDVLYFDIEKSLDEVEVLIVNLMFKYQLYYPHYQHKDWETIAEEEPT